MPRLNKVLKELNVGLNTVAEVLQKKGKPLTEATPNAKITDEQYALLMDAFDNDKKGHDAVRLGIQKRKEREQEKRDERRAEHQREKELKKQKTEGVFRLESEKRQTFKVVGKIEDVQSEASSQPSKPVDSPAPKAEAQPPTENPVAKSEPASSDTPPAPKPVAEAPEAKAPAEKPMTVDAEKPAPVQPQPRQPQQKNAPQQRNPQPQKGSQPQRPQQQPNASQPQPKTPQPKTEPKAEKEPKRVESHFIPTEVPEGSVQVKVVGKIDLDAQNAKTRPEKRKRSRKRSRINGTKVDINAAVKQIKDSEQHKGKKNGNGGNNGGNANNGKNSTGGNNGNGNGNGGSKNNGRNSQKSQQKNQQKSQQSNAQQGQGGGRKRNRRAAAKQPELTDEEIAKQVKETLARLTSKQTKKAVKYRKDKREAIHSRMAEEAEEENAESRVLKLTEYVTANELATMMNIPVTDVISTCMTLGIMVSINQRLDAETINLVAEEFGFTTTYVSEDVSNAIVEEEDAPEDLESRAPIITVMGHVDHGKTSLLDYIRKTNVIAGEAGGITQHIGAYNVKMPSGRHITFLDTPGHEAFTAMRARGAKVTDIAIIIIAADDSVMPQTKEAISHAVAANVPMVFAINKIDKPGANPEKIKEELAAMNYLVEDWGGKYQCQEISAKKGINVDLLMEKVLLEADLLDLKANPNRKATGSVIESSLDKGRGYVATVLVQNGTLHQGDIVLAGTNWGRVKAMFNERGQRIKQALPAEPALLLGLNGAPTAGDTFHVFETEQEARNVANKREQLKREQNLRTTRRKGLEDIAHDIAVGGVQELNLIVKGDVDGSIEALSDSLIKLSTEKIKVNVIHKAVGQISESDVELAKASNAIIIGFQVRPSLSARRLADQEGVDIRLYSIIYDTIGEIKSAMEGMLAPEIKEEYAGTAEVRQVYKITKVGTVAGAMVTEGKIHRSDKIRVIRDGIVVYTGEINALKRFKDDVKEVGLNFECGISIVNYNDIREGDLLETYTEVQVKATL